MVLLIFIVVVVFRGVSSIRRRVIDGRSGFRDVRLRVGYVINKKFKFRFEISRFRVIFVDIIFGV